MRLTSEAETGRMGNLEKWDSPAKNPVEITNLVNADVYKRWRTVYVDELELAVWNIDMLKYAISSRYENYGPLKTAIKRGVPDIIKHYIWIKANDADKFYIEHPNFYKHSFRSTFGHNVPKNLGDHCPTFCGGILGLQVDILGTPAEAKDLDFDSNAIDTESIRVDSRRKSDLGDEYNFWRLPKFHSSPKLTGADMAHSPYSRAVLRNNSMSNCSGFRSFYGKLNATCRKVVSLDAMVSSARSDVEHVLPEVIHENLELEKCDPIFDYLSYVHSENETQKILMKSAMEKIRQLPFYLPPVNRDVNKNRQLSDTCVLNNGYRFPPPPSHHAKLVGMDVCLPSKSSPLNINDPREKFFLFRSENDPMALYHKNDKKRRKNGFHRFLRWIGSCCISRGHAERQKSVVIDPAQSSSVPDDSSDVTGHSGSDVPYKDLDIRFSTIPEMTDSQNYESSTSMKDSICGDELTFVKLSSDSLVSRRASTKIFNSSVYKLTDVTDFTILLTQHGIDEVKRILWCLNSNFASKIEFLPIIPSLCCMLLVYMSPEAALCVLYRLMSRAIESVNMDCGERFLFCDRNGFVIFVKYVLSVMRRQLRKLVVRMQLLNVDLAAWIARAVQHGFSHILPFDYIVRIYGDFLFEGEIVFCRYCIALIKCAQLDLMKCTNQEEAETILYRIGLNPNLNIDEVTKLAYSFRMKHFDDKYKTFDAPSPYLMPVKIKTFYRPRLSTVSSVIPEHAWELLWTWILPAYRILDPDNTYSSEHHGTTLTGIFKRLEEFGKPSSPALLFVKTTRSDVVGSFFPVLTNVANGGFFTSQEAAHQQDTFVFTIKPRENVYRWTGNNATGVKFSREGIVIGADNAALILDKTLTNGYSASCKSYDSPSLVSNESGHFTVGRIELWTLI